MSSKTITTPDSISINHYLRQMVDLGIKYCFMEVSSHGISQHRIEGLNFQVECLQISLTTILTTMVLSQITGM